MTSPGQNKYGTIPARTIITYHVLLGAPGQSRPQPIDSSQDRAAAQARLDELKVFLSGDAPRMVLQQGRDETDWMQVFSGLGFYLAGVGLMALGVASFKR
jgi:hypothetical protein